jgi:hypothetical protein
MALEELKKCEKESWLHYQTFSTHVAVVNLVVKDSSIEIAYLRKSSLAVGGSKR